MPSISDFKLRACYCDLIGHASKSSRLGKINRAGGTQFLRSNWSINGWLARARFSNHRFRSDFDEAFIMLKTRHVSILFPRSFEWYPGGRSGWLFVQKRVRGMHLCGRRYAWPSG